MPVKTPPLEAESVFDDLDPGSTAALVEAAGDVSLLLDPDGVILEATFGSADLRADVGAQWLGRGWMDTLTDEHRNRAAELLRAAAQQPGQVVVDDLTHRLADGADLPLRYSLVQLGDAPRLAAIGRDLRPIATLQQQVLNAQLALERDYWRLRQVETRYNLLFQMAGEPLLIIDPATHRVLEANPLADKLLGTNGKSLVGKGFPVGFDDAGGAALGTLLAEVATMGRGSADRLRSADGTRLMSASANLLRQDDEARILLRLSVAGPGPAGASVDALAPLGALFRVAPDAVVLTDAEGLITAVNPRFLELSQLASEEQAIGRSVDRWLGRTGVDLNVLLTNLRQRETVRLFATSLRGEYGTKTEVEISAALVGDDQAAGFAFFIRDIGRRLAPDNGLAVRLPKSVEQITQQVGRVPLKELVRQSTDLIERLCIEAALELTGDNRASAAELLGVSRQGLYAKLHRYKLADKGVDG